MELLNFLKSHLDDVSMHVEISYNKTTDWIICIYRIIDNNHIDIYYGSNIDLDYLMADAEVKLKDWFLTNEGGY